VGDVADVAVAVLDADGKHDPRSPPLLASMPVVPGAEADQVAAAALERLEAVGDVGVHFCRPWIFSGLGMRFSRKALKISLAAGAATRSEK
jgi:hypothetical protein